MTEAADLGFWEKIIGIMIGVGTVSIAALKGIFMTKMDCEKKKSVCVSGIREELQKIHLKIDEGNVATTRALKEGNDRFAKTQNYIIAITTKLGIKPDDIAEI